MVYGLTLKSISLIYLYNAYKIPECVTANIFVSGLSTTTSIKSKTLSITISSGSASGIIAFSYNFHFLNISRYLFCNSVSSNPSNIP